MTVENQAFLNLSRWPPVWYLKDYDHYLREKQNNLKRTRWWRQDFSEQSAALINKL